MKMNDLKRLENVLNTGANEIIIDEAVRKQAEVSLKRMVDFAKEHISTDINVTGDT